MFFKFLKFYTVQQKSGIMAVKRNFLIFQEIEQWIYKILHFLTCQFFHLTSLVIFLMEMYIFYLLYLKNPVFFSTSMCHINNN